MRGSVVGYLDNPRYGLSAEARYRFMPAFYAFGTAGTVYFPQPEGVLSRGLYGSVGVGMDFER